MMILGYECIQEFERYQQAGNTGIFYAVGGLILTPTAYKQNEQTRWSDGSCRRILLFVLHPTSEIIGLDLLWNRCY